MLVFSATIVDIQARVMGSGGLQPWTSWSQVHADLSGIRIIPQSAHLDLVRIEATWWIIPVSSLAFAVMAIIGLVYCVQNDSSYASRSLGKWFRSTIFRQDSDDDTFIQSSRHFSSHIILKSPTPPLPVHLLTSGWDESLRPSQAAKLRPKPPALTCDIPVTSSTTSTPDSDASFKESTLTYLQSPTGREALELASLPSLAQISPPLPATTPPDHTDILSSPWPRPPSTVPTTPTKSISIPSPEAASRSPRRHNRAPSLTSLTSSLSSSTISNSAYINDPDLYLHTVLTSPHRPPFQDAGVPTDGQTSGTRTPTRPRRMPSKESIVHKNLSSSMKRAAGRKKDKEYGEAIYMTVVQETQAF
ncbi:hypothetical protein PHLCEN_2v5300 [Hermanssonia centrifuga]|uniref:Uncharacterized protein n=1 Tax=Hermanssonia centrifuga TaxID=98765 RepID=A0A2R6P8H5_9APHY|nr:hypothetical protein PHLCEN_2v5300 [Hermanssonia centrifuga]